LQSRGSGLGKHQSLTGLLANLQPVLAGARYVFVSMDESSVPRHLVSASFATVREREGLTLVLDEERAVDAGFDGLAPFARITLNVHSGLRAVGLTAAVAGALATADIPANVVAGCHHDHVFVPVEMSGEALEILGEMERDAGG
jgi:hypothetical protein